MRKRGQSRRGTLVVCVLVCLLVAGSIVTATTQSALRARRDVRLDQQMRQTELLLDAGVLRAARQLQSSDAYRGETWQPTTSISRFDNPTVEIRVEASQESDESLDVTVTASLGFAAGTNEAAPATLTRRSHIFQFNPNNQESDPPVEE